MTRGVSLRSQALIVRATATFRRNPGDDAVRILDVARLAMHAVRGVDLQALAATAVIHHLVDVRGTEVLARIAEFLATPRGTDRRVRDLEMNGLLLIVLRRCEEHGLTTGLAGSLRISDIRTLAALGPDYLGFRGGLCEEGDRRTRLAVGRIAEALSELASTLPVSSCA